LRRLATDQAAPGNHLFVTLCVPAPGAALGLKMLVEERVMPRGDKSSYTDKQKRKAEHIADGYEERGVSKKTAEARAWATVNKQDGGGKKSGAGRKKAKSSTKKKASRKKKST
jgi:plasmid stabilization system protein ParE